MEDIDEINKLIRLIKRPYKLKTTFTRRMEKINTGRIITKYRKQPFKTLSGKVFINFLNKVKKFIRQKTKENKKTEERKQRGKTADFKKVMTGLLRKNNFQGILDKVVDRSLLLDNKQFSRLATKLDKLGKFTIEVNVRGGDKYIRNFNGGARPFFGALLKDPTITTDKLTLGSDKMKEWSIADVISLKINKLNVSKVFKNKDGKFFPYLNDTIMDLTKYQIYNKADTTNKKLLKTRKHCLIHTLLLCGIPKAVVNEVVMGYVSGNHFRKKDIAKIVDVIGCNITLHERDVNKGGTRIRKKTYGNYDKEIKIALYENHYFIFEMTEYTNFFVNNYDDLVNIENPFQISRKEVRNGKTYYRRNGRAPLNSLILVHNLFKKGKFVKGDMSMFEETKSHTKIKHDIYLDNIKNEQQPIEFNFKPNEIERIVYADCESFVNDDIHKLYMIGCVSNDNDVVEIYNITDFEKPEFMISHFLNYITKYGESDAIVYFHNLKYDYTILQQYLNIRDICVKDNQVYSVQLTFKKKTIILKDSYKIIPFALSKFTKEFELDDKYKKKEAIAYNYYTPENNSKRVKVDEYRKLLTNKNKKIFDEIITKHKSYSKKTKTFNPLVYYIEYLKLDCLVLKKGFEKFNSLVEKITDNKISPYDVLTISSLTDKFMMLEGCYEGCYEVKGNLREYIGRAVYGGRVAVNEKYKKKVVNGKIADYDGVSLYPSAIYRLCQKYGIFKGEAKRWNASIDWKNTDYAVMTVRIKEVRKNQQMPFIAHKGEGSTDYTNSAPVEPIVIDKITLEDYIEFHDITYEILDGVYWDGGFNKKIGFTTNKLFKQRLKYKKSNKAIANTIKLMLNSIYGKTIMKKATTETKIVNSSIEKKQVEGEWVEVNNGKFENYIYNNFNTITKYRAINGYKYEVEKMTADFSYNRAHIGCSILSMSKRIMNEVFDVANTNKLPIFYTDTDSLHCYYDDVAVLEEKYGERYGRELNGKFLGQFHTDFDMEGAVGDIYATKSIFLGKKSYLDVLESKNDKGETIHDYHIRLKGITKEGLELASRNYDNSYLGLYEDLSNGNEVKFTLNPVSSDDDINKVLFDFKGGNVSTKNKPFIRKVKF